MFVEACQRSVSSDQALGVDADLSFRCCLGPSVLWPTRESVGFAGPIHKFAASPGTGAIPINVHLCYHRIARPTVNPNGERS